MKAEDYGFLDIVFESGRKQYQIPVYQRNYDWKKDNCLVLFNDVISAYQEERSHFLGTIVQVQQDEEGGIKKYIIIDGQQRMTTVYLLLKALYDSTTDEVDKEDLKGILFNSNSDSKKLARDDKLKLKLKPIKTDNKEFLLLMDDELEEMDQTSNIYVNYNYFLNLIKDAGQKEITPKNILTGLKKLKIVLISLDKDKDDPQLVFERINSTGEDLTLADLIRNYILMTDSNMEELYENYWLPIESTVGKDRLVSFFQTYLIYRLPDNNKDQYQSFKNYVGKNGISHEELLKEMKRLAKYYFAFVSYSPDYSDKVNNVLDGFRSLKQATIYPFFFGIFDDFANGIISEDTLYSVLVFFLNYTIRRSITGVPTNTLRGLYKGLYKRIFTDEATKAEYLHSIYSFMAQLTSNAAVPNDTIFKDRLMTEDIYKNRDSCRLILKILENGLDSLKETVNIGKGTTIEHVMPQNGDSEEWHKEIGSDYAYVYDKYLHTLGNLTLTGYNSELSDKSFLEKREMIRANSKFVVLNSDIIDKEHWNEDTIKARAERLSNRLLEELKLPDEFKKAKREISDNRHTVDETTNFSGMKPTSFILLGESRELATASDLLLGVCEILYDLDTEKMLGLARENYIPDNSQKVLFSLNTNVLRSGKEIGNSGIYVETNKSFNDIVRTIKKLLELFNLSSDDFLFYASR